MLKTAKEIKHLAVCYNTQGFYNAIKTLYGSRKQIFTPAAGDNLFKDRQESLLNHTLWTPISLTRWQLHIRYNI